jgi:hypothetical protein
MKVKDKVLVDPGAQELQLIAGKNIDNILMKTVNVNECIQGGPAITCQKNSGSLEGSNKSKQLLFVRSKIMGIN